MEKIKTKEVKKQISKGVDSYRSMSLADLSKELPKLEVELLNFRREQMLGKLENHYKIIRVKRNIARVKTFTTLKKLLLDIEKDKENKS